MKRFIKAFTISFVAGAAFSLGQWWVIEEKKRKLERERLKQYKMDWLAQRVKEEEEKQDNIIRTQWSDN